MKALCLVAHPDDCVIFAYSFIHNHPELHWTICYLTYTEQDPRGAELAEFWSRRCIPTQFLGYVDDYRDIENRRISFDTGEAHQAIQYLCKNFDIILTHDAEGDYGHIHHKFVHSCVPEHHPHVITFAPPGAGTDTYMIPEGTYNLSELPQHRQIVESFHSRGHANCYSVPPATKIQLDKIHN